ncbi:efflux transporter outer membrane subunit [Methylobacterium sp. 77]|uniref:efflux transporter outer membrane subunit n=1 Tax=Methylobacterium sp. 77 TaxID=1101192 RepID=UPI0003659024|nr:efflux transporter outer membrane subunit [Methylobacterium sp. 77]
MTPIRITGCLAAFALLLSGGGCMVGPDFRAPHPPALSRYGAEPDPVRLDAPGGTQVLAYGAEEPATWWRLFRSRRLDGLVREGLAANPGLAQAEAALREARSQTDAARAGLLPELSGGLDRSGSGPVRGGSVFGLYGANLAASYGVDLFGGLRRGVEAQAALEVAAAERLRAAALTLSGAIVTAAIQEAGLSAQITVAETILRRYRQQLDLIQVREAARAEPVATVLTQRSLIHAQEGTLVALRAQRTLTRHQLAALTGQAPSRYEAPGFGLAELPLPRRVPVRLPAALVAQRPDIRVAEAELHAASARIGVATADRLPQITLTASLGTSTATLAGLAAASGWATAAGLVQPLFDGGARAARQEGAIAAYDGARAGYRGTVLTALREVADALTALDADARRLTAAMQAEDLARQALDAIQIQYRAGGLPYTDLLLAQTRYATTSLTRLAVQTQRLTDTALLLQVLGGSWEERPREERSREQNLSEGPAPERPPA